MERTSVFDTIKFRPGFCFFCFEQITVFQYFRDNSTIKDLEKPLFFLWMEIYWFSVLGEGCVLKWSSNTSILHVIGMTSSGVTPVRPIEPCLDKYNQVRIFFFDATIMIYHVSLQTCFKMYNGV